MKTLKNNLDRGQSAWISGTLFLLYFSVPLMFSHVALLFGVNWTFEAFGNYEGLRKMLVTVVCGVIVLAVTVMMLAGKGGEKKSLFEGTVRYWGVFAGLTFLIFVVQVFVGGNPLWILTGDDPFYMGLGLFGVLGLLVGVLLIPSQHERRFATWGLFAGAGCVMLYAVLQYFSIDPIDYVVPFESERVFSTLGNANMLAGYLVLLLPFILERDFRYWRTALCFGILLGVMTTGSWTMFALGLGFCVWRFWKDSGLPKFWGVLLVLILSVTCIQLALEQEVRLEGKILSGFTRLELINSGTNLALESVRGVFFGHTPAEIWQAFNPNRSSELLEYIPSTNTLFHTHFTPIDWMIRYGTFGIFALCILFSGYLFSKGKYSVFSYKNTSSISREVLVLFVIFCLFHQPETVHYMILVLGLSQMRKG